MGNMAYCRFQNTLGDLEECKFAMDNHEELSPEEATARDDLISLCIEIAKEHGEE